MIAATLLLAILSAPTAGDDLYRRDRFAALIADQRAAAIGDGLTVLVFQAAEASNSAQNTSRKATDLAASINAGALDEGGRATLGGGFTGRGEARRTERFVTQLSVTVAQVLANGDLIVTGRQRMEVNGEKTEIEVRGRVRLADISADNTVLSTRIADAAIRYGGRGFVSRGAGAGFLNRVFSLLGLG